MKITFSKDDTDLSEDTRWYLGSHRYPRRTVKNPNPPPRQIKEHAHRIVLQRKIGRQLHSGEEADHINGDVLDCRRENLRIVNHSGSMQNRKTRHGKFRGTTFHKASGKWQASIQVNNKCIYLGLFKSREEASQIATGARLRHGFMSGNGIKP